MKSFQARFGVLISFVLSSIDRLRFCGESRRLNNVRGVDSYLLANSFTRPRMTERFTVATMRR
jgi:hypothetical protein